MTIVSDSKIKARKEHSCDYCNGLIKIKETYRSVFISDDYAYTWKSHLSCDALVDKLNMIDYSNGEGISEELFVDTVINKFYNIQSDFPTPDLKANLNFNDKLIFVKQFYSLEQNI